MSEAEHASNAEQANESVVRANERASGQVLTSEYLVVLDHSASVQLQTSYLVRVSHSLAEERTSRRSCLGNRDCRFFPGVHHRRVPGGSPRVHRLAKITAK